MYFMRCIHTAIVVVAGLSFIGLSSATDMFEKPLRLMFADGFVDSGAAWGHSGPCLGDVDGDDAQDLVVGDFSGKFRVFRNTGTNESPVYEAPYYLQADGKDAEVNVY